MIKRKCVDQERWIDEEQFKKILAVYQVLPGPEAHEVCVHFGRERAASSRPGHSRRAGALKSGSRWAVRLNSS
jgi:hypothetical protein